MCSGSFTLCPFSLDHYTVALKAMEVYALSTPWRHQDTTTIAVYGAYEGEVPPDAPQTQDEEVPVPPRPTYSHSKEGRDDLPQVLVSLGVSGDGGLPLRVGIRDGNTSDRLETPRALEACRTLGLAGGHGIVADSKGYSQRTIGRCLENGGAW
jgi:transposase